MMNKSIFIVFAVFVISVTLASEVKSSNSLCDDVTKGKSTQSGILSANLESGSTISCNLKKTEKRMLQDDANPSSEATVTDGATTEATTPENQSTETTTTPSSETSAATEVTTIPSTETTTAETVSTETTTTPSTEATTTEAAGTETTTSETTTAPSTETTTQSTETTTTQSTETTTTTGETTTTIEATESTTAATSETTTTPSATTATSTESATETTTNPSIETTATSTATDGATTTEPSTEKPTSQKPTDSSTVKPSTEAPTTTAKPSTETPTGSATIKPTTEAPTTVKPTTEAPTGSATSKPSTEAPTSTEKPSNKDYSFTFSICSKTLTTPEATNPTTEAPATSKPSTEAPTSSETAKPSTEAPTTSKPTTEAPTTSKPSTEAPTGSEATKPTTEATTTGSETVKPSTEAPSTANPSVETSTANPSTDESTTPSGGTTSNPSTENTAGTETTTASTETTTQSTESTTEATSTQQNESTTTASTETTTQATESTTTPVEVTTTPSAETTTGETTEATTQATEATTQSTETTTAETTEATTQATETTTTPSAEATTAETTTTPSDEVTTQATETTAQSTETTTAETTTQSTENEATSSNAAIRLLLETAKVKTIVNTTLYTYYTNNKVNPINYNTQITESLDNKLQVEVTLTVIPSEISEANRIESELKDGTSNYFDTISEQTNGEYGSCGDISTGTEEEETTTTGTIAKIKTECSYVTKKVYILNGKSDAILPKNNVDYDIEYKTDCEFKINSTTGEFTVPTESKTNNYKKCTITCEGPSESYIPTTVLFQYKVTEYKYSVDKLLSKFPYVIYPNEYFDTTLVLSYPIVDELNEEDEKKEMIVSLSLNNYDDYTLINEPINTAEKTYFEYKNVNITTTKTNDGKIKLIFQNDTQLIHASDEITIIGLNKAAECNEDDRDTMGLCCDKKPTKESLMCKNMTLVLPFVNEVSDKLHNSYEKLFKKLIFNNTNYLWYSEIEKTKKYTIVVQVNIGNETKVYKNDEIVEGEVNNNNNNRELDTDLPFNDYDYVKVVASILECTEESEIEQKIESLPPQYRQQIQNNGITTEVLKQSINEVVSVMVSEGNSIDMAVGISTDYDYVPPNENDNNDNKSWAEKYWYVILIICLVVVILLVVVGVVTYSFLTSNTINKYEKNEKIMETVVPIEKIKQENEISDDDIYKPFSYEVILEGYLLKEGHDRVIGKWQRRYCVLYFEPAVLRIYDSMVPSYYGKVYIEEKQSIPLDCYNGIEYEDGNNEFTLVLKVSDSNLKTFEKGENERKIHLKVEGENAAEIAKKWVECFRDFKNQKPKSTSDAWTKPLMVDQQNGKISTQTNRALEKKNQEIVLKMQERKQQGKVVVQKATNPYE